MKFGKRLMPLALALVMIFGLTTGVSAAAAQNVTAKLSPDITVKLGDETQAMADANGSPVYPILYNGTTYLPIRAIADMMKIDVTWFAPSKTVILVGSAHRTDLTASDKADSKTAPNAASKDITVRIDPGINVEYNGEAQKMTDANGSPVYPISYNDTTYLPVRAVSDMLDVDVTWNQNTRTVTLVKSTGMTSTGLFDYFDFGNDVSAVAHSNDIEVRYHNSKTHEYFSFDQLDDLRAALEKADCSESLIDKALKIFVDGYTPPAPKPAIDPFNNVQTSSGNGIETISDTCVAREWGMLDWSNANDGYVTVTVNKLAGPNTCIDTYTTWLSANERLDRKTERCHLGQGEYRIPLQGGNAEYVVRLKYVTHACEHMCTADENAAADKFSGTSLIARFNAEIDNPGAAWLASTPHADYESAPKTQAKARELTKNCKTDAEKVTAIFNWVAANIKYDKQLSAALDAAVTHSGESCYSNPNGWHNTPDPDYAVDYYDLDKILTSRSGICAHYAALTVGMLRSVGVPCRAVGGEAYLNNEWGGHAWVEISPSVTGLNKTALGAGTGEDGWTRIDPTNAHIPNITSKDDNYRPSSFYF